MVRFLLLACALATPHVTSATGVPIGGFLPLVGIGLSNEFKDDFDTFAAPSAQAPAAASMLGPGGMPHYDVALLDTGAGFSLLTAQADANFNIDGPYPGEPDGYRGTETIDFGGATGTLTADINDPLGLYAGGLQARTNTTPLTLDHSKLKGQTNTSMITIPASSDLPNVVGLTFASQYATHIRSDQPQIFELDGRTVRTPYVDFQPLGSGGQEIVRRAPLSLNPGGSFLGPPTWVYNLENFDIDNPQENPSYPTLLQAATGGAFLNVTAQNAGNNVGTSQFLFDTGADVTVISELNAVQLGFDPLLDEPDFTVAVVGSGGTSFDVPGFFVDQLTILAVGGSLTLTNVPIVVLDVTNPGDPGNVVPGIIGTNVFAGRNLVFDPKPSDGSGGVGPSLYISDPVTTQKNWTTAAASGTFATGGNWNAGTAPTTLGVANVRHISGGNQTAVVAANATVWELNVSGSLSQSMTVQVNSGVTLTTFSGINIETNGVVSLAGGTLDAQFVEIAGGTLRGAGQIVTGSGPIPGQVENRGGTVAPGNGIGKLEIEGRFASDSAGTLAIELGGLIAATQYDQLAVDGSVALAGNLAVSLANLGGGSFVPSVGDAFTIITATEGVGGSFDAIDAPGGYNWNVVYGISSVTLSVGVPGDYNDDGIVNAADYTVWRNSFGTVGSNLPADGNGSGLVDEGDYAIWKMHFGESLGGGGASSAVPEPGGIMLLLLAVTVLVASPRHSPLRRPLAA
jgi:Aspartyl protease